MTRAERNDPRDPKSRAGLDAQQAAILGPTGQPARLAPDARCPCCGAGPDQRVLSAGFGEPHEVCQSCAWEFES